MIYRLDSLEEGPINPLTGSPWTDDWVVFMLMDSTDTQQLCGSFHGCAYTVKTSRTAHPDWKMAAGDFMSFHQAAGHRAVLCMSEAEYAEVIACYQGHGHSDRFLRPDEPLALIHSTPPDSWAHIRQDGMLKSWNRLCREGFLQETQPIGRQLGDPADFSDYIMFGSGVTGELVVSSRQRGGIAMDPSVPYTPGARLYFDAARMAADGLLLRDGCHIKVKDELPLQPYLLFAATWENIGLERAVSSPAAFARQADECFRQRLRS
ncbi:MAG: hypothetical protein SOY30_08785 [Eubacteriales bacterium]|nr:hypothetical protein [Eubacteriales bacterium]